MCWSVFMVSAMTDDPLVFFDSDPDSGYSVDNLAPDGPSRFQVVYGTEGNDLSWSESPAPDLLAYLIYRDGYEGFEPGRRNLVRTTRRTSWFDDLNGLAEGAREVFYKIAAQDSSGNIGEFVVPAGDPLPARFALHHNQPNPFSPATVIRYDLPVPSEVSLRIFDVSGRHVKTLAAGEAPAGRHSVVWDARDEAGRAVSAGVYFYRLRAGIFDATRRMMLIK
jgi:hypothetical protein